MKFTPLVTVLMPVYDTPPEYLEQAIASIRLQTFKEFEFLILDDGSAVDAVRETLNRHAAEDWRIRVVYGPHMGLTRTLNYGLTLARGEWIARQDADDWSASRRIERQMEFLSAHPEIGLCGTAAWTHQQDGRVLTQARMPCKDEEIRAAFWKGNPFTHGSAIFRTALARRAGGYREEFPCSQDYDFFWRLSELTGVANLSEPLYHYRYSAGAVSARKAELQASAHRATRKLAEMRREGKPENVSLALEESQAEITLGSAGFQAALKQADHQMLAGEYLSAGKSFCQLLASQPWNPVAWGKLARWVVFAALPPFRGACFR
jgi:glycosyltransferase involved in cell wall biosynthesis